RRGKTHPVNSQSAGGQGVLEVHLVVELVRRQAVALRDVALVARRLVADTALLGGRGRGRQQGQDDQGRGEGHQRTSLQATTTGGLGSLARAAPPVPVESAAPFGRGGGAGLSILRVWSNPAGKTTGAARLR